MMDFIKTELMKEKRGANFKLGMIVPIIFVLLNIAMVSLMGESPKGKSYIMATSFNWYPLLILPIILSLLVLNISSKEKIEHIVFQKSMNVSFAKIELAKNIVILMELFTILVVSSFLIFIFVTLFSGENIVLAQLVLATGCLFIGSLPIIALSFLIYGLVKKKAVLILLNFILSFPSPVIAITNNWILFPWSYSLRMLSPVVGVHPNGTFLDTSSELMNMKMIYLGLCLSIVVYVLILILNLLIKSKRGERSV
ncbi:ABC transporter permease [Aerococcaceae bacterium zg-BR22]|uniref:ABC transporter permease n=1 Tax=Aerococcaceae bacterium zg-1292 TaxID=2774330 RepID=UPI004063D1A3|nr:ABC transporter permease [Aerococcaceae bacterium zg-BR22]